MDFLWHLSADAEIWLAFLTSLLVLVTGALARYTYKLWHATYELGLDAKKTANRQADEMRESLAIAKQSAEAAIAAQRPWISITVVRGELSITNDRVRIDVLFKFENTGNTPATSIRVIPQMAVVPLKINLDMGVAVRKALEQPKSEFAFLSAPIFPGAPRTQQYGMDHPRSQIIETADASEGDEFHARMVMITVGGCIDYEFAGGTGQTTFNFAVAEPGPQRCGITIAPQTVTSPNLKFAESATGVYAR